MIFYSWKNTLGFFLLCITSSVGSLTYLDPKNKSEFLYEGRLTIEALDKALTFLYEHQNNLIKDVIFGVLIARENLRWIQARSKFRHRYLSKQLMNLVKKCNIIIETNKVYGFSPLNEVLWNNSAKDLTNGTLLDEDLLPLKFDSCESINDFMMDGNPEDSDFCISELLKSQCHISDKCWASEMRTERHTGYKTSHRLMYLQIAQQLNCQVKNLQKFLSIKVQKKKLCQQMLTEARSLHEEPHFPLTQDLFLEQIALCGMEGYTEFAPKTWRKEVRNLQSYNGCFGLGMDVNNCSVKETRVKRTDSIADGCHFHVTAVGISALAFHLRVVLAQELFEN